MQVWFSGKRAMMVAVVMTGMSLAGGNDGWNEVQLDFSTSLQ